MARNTKKKTHEEFVKEVYELVGDEYTVMGEYKNSKTKISLRHNICNEIYEVRPNNFLLGARCPSCSGKKKRSHDDFVKEVYELVGDEYTVVGEYKNTLTSIKILHNECGHVFSKEPNKFLKNPSCGKCSLKNRKSNKKKTHEVFVKEVYELVGDEYTVVGTYTNSKSEIEIKHNKCNTTYKVRAYVNNVTKCPKCNCRSKQHEVFVKEVYELVGNDYTILTTYKNCKEQIGIRHNICNTEYLISPNKFLSGIRCSVCSGNKKKTHEEFVKEVYDKVGDEYTVLSEYKNASSKIRLKHNTCNYTFEVLVSNFLNKNNRCPYCFGTKKKTHDEFVKEVYELVGDEYTVLSEYKNCKTPLKIRHNNDTCKNYSYQVTPDGFLNNGNRCPKCAKISGSSKIEKELLNFVKENSSYKIIENDRQVLNGKEIDIYIPELKIGIEVCGLYWHSEELLGKRYHYDKMILAREKGVFLIQIFEDEINHKKDIVYKKILHLLHASKYDKKIYARKCTIKEIDNAVKKDFLIKNHIQGNDKSVIKLGLFYDDVLVSVLTLCKPRKALGREVVRENEYELSRFASDLNNLVVGGFSKLLKYAIQNYNVERIYTYSDNRYSVGNLYLKNNFTFEKCNLPNYHYYLHGKRYHRYSFRKNKLKDLFPLLYNEKLTEHQIMDKTKYRRIWDAGTSLYVYDVNKK